MNILRNIISQDKWAQIKKNKSTNVLNICEMFYFLKKKKTAKLISIGSFIETRSSPARWRAFGAARRGPRGHGQSDAAPWIGQRGHDAQLHERLNRAGASGLTRDRMARLSGRRGARRSAHSHEVHRVASDGAEESGARSDGRRFLGDVARMRRLP